MQEEVTRRCEACRECQRVAERHPPCASLQVMPIIETLFDRVALDVMGPLLKSSAGQQFILLMIDYAMWYSESVPLRVAMATWIAEELLKWMSWVGVP